MPDLLYTPGGGSVRLGPALAAGGEGTVRPLPDRPGACAKVYHARARTPERRRKLEAMLARAPRDPTRTQGHRSLAWPQQLLLEAPGGPLAGFVMPLLPAGARPALEFMQPEDRRHLHPGFHFRYLLTAARNAASAFAAVHQAGCCVGDVNESNTMLTGTALVTLIDCDSFQVGGLPCPVGKPEYTAPELAGRALGSARRTPQSDAFGLAVLIFQLLMQGYHPFAGRWRLAGEPPAVGRRIQSGLYAYARRAELEPPPAAPPARVLPPRVRTAFARAFVAGIRDPRRRPSPAEWTSILDAALGDLSACRAGAGQHHYPRALRTCPWCALARRGDDYFPRVVGTQVALPDARAAIRAVRVPAAAEGRPQLVFEPREVTLRGVVRGAAAPCAALTMRNVGRAWFRGRVAVGSGAPVVAVTPSELALSPFHGENEARLTVRVDTRTVDWGRRYVRFVRAGGASARVVVAVADSGAAASAAGRYARIGVWAAPALAGALALGAGWRLPEAAGAADLRLLAAALTPVAAAGWLAGVGACVALSRAWRLRRRWPAWRQLWRDRRWSPRAALAAAALVLWPALGLSLAARYGARPSPGRLEWDLALLLVPPAWLAGRALAWAAAPLARRMVSRHGARMLMAVGIAAGIALGGTTAAAGALLGLGQAGGHPRPAAVRRTARRA